MPPLDRTVESNLVVLCGCLPTFRIFIKHMRPESRYGKGSTAASGSGRGSNPRSPAEKGFSLRTFGQGGRTRRHFDTMASIDAMGDGMDLNDSTGDYRVTVDTHTAPGSSRSGSEEAIIQTTTIVQTSKFVPPEQDISSGLLESRSQPARPVDLTDV